VIPTTEKAIVVYFGNFGVENPATYVDVFDTQSIAWGSRLVNIMKNSRKLNVSATVSINGDHKTAVVSIYCRWC
jgi:hypothetical protein